MAREKAPVTVVDGEPSAVVMNEVPAEGGSYIRQPETGTLELQERTKNDAPVEQAAADSHIDFNA